MAIAAAKRTHTYGRVPVGSAEREIHRLVQKYQAQWDANLASAYSNHLTPTELQSLAKNGKSSPYIENLKQAQPLVGDDMKKTSSDILNQLVTEALTNSFRDK
jgi:hypothetical protein